MGILYLAIGVIMWILIIYGVYRLIGSIVRFIKEKIESKKENVENDYQAD